MSLRTQFDAEHSLEKVHSQRAHSQLSLGCLVQGEKTLGTPGTVLLPNGGLNRQSNDSLIGFSAPGKLSFRQNQPAFGNLRGSPPPPGDPLNLRGSMRSKGREDISEERVSPFKNGLESGQMTGRSSKKVVSTVQYLKDNGAVFK